MRPLAPDAIYDVLVVGLMPETIYTFGGLTENFSSTSASIGPRFSKRHSTPSSGSGETADLDCPLFA